MAFFDLVTLQLKGLHGLQSISGTLERRGKQAGGVGGTLGIAAGGSFYKILNPGTYPWLTEGALITADGNVSKDPQGFVWGEITLENFTGGAGSDVPGAIFESTDIYRGRDVNQPPPSAMASRQAAKKGGLPWWGWLLLAAAGVAGGRAVFGRSGRRRAAAASPVQTNPRRRARRARRRSRRAR